MNSKLRGACRECWDPVDKPEAVLCDWCYMTPKQRRKKLLRSWVLFGVCAVLFVVSVVMKSVP